MIDSTKVIYAIGLRLVGSGQVTDFPFGIGSIPPSPLEELALSPQGNVSSSGISHVFPPFI